MGTPAGVMELVDVVDSKSTAGDSVPVRVRSPAPRRSKLYIACSDLFYTAVRTAAAQGYIPIKTETSPEASVFCHIYRRGARFRIGNRRLRRRPAGRCRFWETSCNLLRILILPCRSHCSRRDADRRGSRHRNSASSQYRQYCPPAPGSADAAIPASAPGSPSAGE